MQKRHRGTQPQTNSEKYAKRHKDRSRIGQLEVFSVPIVSLWQKTDVGVN